jgi:hypothetical protein
VLAQHSTIRTAVMGEEASERERRAHAELEAMKDESAKRCERCRRLRLVVLAEPQRLGRAADAVDHRERR